MEAMQAQSIDVVKRMKDITLVMQIPEQVLEDQGVTATHIEGILSSIHLNLGLGVFLSLFCF